MKTTTIIIIIIIIIHIINNILIIVTIIIITGLELANNTVAKATKIFCYSSKKFVNTVKLSQQLQC